MGYLFFYIVFFVLVFHALMESWMWESVEVWKAQWKQPYSTLYCYAQLIQVHKKGGSHSNSLIKQMSY